MIRTSSYLSNIIDFKKEYFGINLWKNIIFKKIIFSFYNLTMLILISLCIIAGLMYSVESMQPKSMDMFVSLFRKEVYYLFILLFIVVFINSISIKIEEKIYHFAKMKDYIKEVKLLIESKMLSNSIVNFVDKDKGINEYTLMKLLNLLYDEKFLIYKDEFEKLNYEDLTNAEKSLYMILLLKNKNLNFKYKEEIYRFFKEKEFFEEFEKEIK